MRLYGSLTGVRGWGRAPPVPEHQLLNESPSVGVRGLMLGRRQMANGNHVKNFQRIYPFVRDSNEKNA